MNKEFDEFSEMVENIIRKLHDSTPEMFGEDVDARALALSHALVSAELMAAIVSSNGHNDDKTIESVSKNMNEAIMSRMKFVCNYLNSEKDVDGGESE
jgi:hypothetical protein